MKEPDDADYVVLISRHDVVFRSKLAEKKYVVVKVDGEKLIAKGSVRRISNIASDSCTAILKDSKQNSAHGSASTKDLEKWFSWRSKRFPVSAMSTLKKPGTKIAIGCAVVLLIAGVVLARLWCPSASERANAITMEDVEKQLKSYETSKKLAKAGKELVETRAGSAEREEKLEALISLLDPATQAYIRSLPREDRIEAITKKIKEDNESKEAALKRKELKEKLCWWR